MGKWSLWLYFAITLTTMFTVTAAVTYVTVALIAALTGLESNTFILIQVTVLYGLIVVWLLLGKFKALDKLIKIIAGSFVIALLVAIVALFLNKPQHAVSPVVTTVLADHNKFIFVIALMGWMPTAVDLSAWNSIWTVERMKETGSRSTLRQVLLDFKIGYWTSAVLAILFLMLGAELMFYQGAVFPNPPAAFSAKLISLFTQQVGAWSYVLVAVATIGVMLSTSITVFDGYARAMSVSCDLLGGTRLYTQYSTWLILTATGGLVVILFFNQQLKLLVDVATIISFMVAPVVAILNLRLVNSAQVPVYSKPGKFMQLWALVGIFFLVAFTLLFLFSMIS